MKKRMISLVLALCLALPLAAPTMAYEAPEAPPNFDGNEAAFQEYINSISNSYTITFDESDQPQDILHSNVSAQSTSNDTETYKRRHPYKLPNRPQDTFSLGHMEAGISISTTLLVEQYKLTLKRNQQNQLYKNGLMVA